MKLLPVGFSLGLGLQTEPDLRAPSLVEKTDEGKFEPEAGIPGVPGAGRAAPAQQPLRRAAVPRLRVPVPPREQLSSFAGQIFLLIDLFAFTRYVLVCVPAWHPIQYVYIYFGSNPKARMLPFCSFET